LTLWAQKGVQCPILNRLKCVDLGLALHNQTHRNGLHTTRRKSSPHLVPKQRRYLIANQPIQHASRLLGIHKVLIHIAGMIESFLHRLLGDLVEGHAPYLFLFLGRRPQLKSKVIRDRLAFAIRVRRQKDFIRTGSRPLQLRYDLLLARRHNQRRYKCAILQLHANVVLGQIHDVPDRREDLEALT
jgi:hypothetical protein